MFCSFAPQKPKDVDGILKVALMGRVSTTKQAIENIDAGYKYAKQILKGIYEGDCLIKELGDCASGMRSDRPSLIELLALIESGWPDLVLMEDLSKLHRNPRFQLEIVQDCVDKGIRVIALGDNLDTFDENWEIALSAATMQHGTHIPHTRRRVRRTAVSSFQGGGMVLHVRFGYRKVDKKQAATGEFGPKGLRIMKLSEWTPTILKVRDMVVNEVAAGTKRLDDVVEFLNQAEVPVGPKVKSGRWHRRILQDLLRDPILYGGRRFRQVAYHYVYGTGEHWREKNPNPEVQYVPELAHITREQWDELQRALDTLKHKGDREYRSGRENVRYRVSRKKTTSPHQHARCISCGAVFYRCGENVMKCKNGLNRGTCLCWNHVQIECDRAREALVDIVLQRIEREPQAWQAMLDETWRTIEQIHGRSNVTAAAEEKRIKVLQDQATRLAKAISMGADLGKIVEESKTVKKALKAAIKTRDERMNSETKSTFPSSREEFVANPKETLLELAATSFEFGDLMRRIFPRFEIQPVQALDCGLVRPRACLTLDLAALLPATSDVNGGPEPEQIVVDLFEPPVHIKHLPAVLALQKAKKERNEKASLKILARELGISHMTVKRAMDYSRLMERLQVTEPYRVLREKPESASRWKPRSRPIADQPRAA